MMPLCFAPIVFAGYFAGIETSWHHQPDISGAYVEAQTCKDGLGAHVKAGQGVWVAGGVHYGFTWPLGYGFSMTIQPAIGGSYFNKHHPVTGERQIGRFEVGLGVLVSKEQFSLGCDYLHMSNGEGHHPGNIGADGIGCKVGMAIFH